MWKRTPARVAGVSSPWFENRIGNGERALPNVDARMPRGAYAPRSCVAVRMSADEKAIFAMDERMFTRAATVSPPWFGNETGLQCTPNHVRPLTTTERRAAGVSSPWFENRIGNGERVLPNVDARMPRGAYAPRSFVAVRMSADEKAIFAMDERMFTRAAGVSPPWFCEPNAAPQESNILQRLSNTHPRAAGVSPPWFGNALQRG
jgi:hypothetical protein